MGDGLTVKLRDIHKHYGTVHGPRAVDLTIAKGGVWVDIGRSGSGKSTLLRCINQLEVTCAGRVILDGPLQGNTEVSGRFYLGPPRKIAEQRRRTAWYFNAVRCSPK